MAFVPRILRAAYRLMLVRETPARRLNGKPWAMKQGIDHASVSRLHFLPTDADIVYAPGVLSWLVKHAQDKQLGLVSLCKTPLPRLARKNLHSGLLLFFPDDLSVRMVNNPRRAIAAAGGCMPVRAMSWKRPAAWKRLKRLD